MPRCINTVALNTIQQTAVCPVCSETVYADGLTPLEPYTDPVTGAERFRKLRIACPHCGRTRIVTPRSL